MELELIDHIKRDARSRIVFAATILCILCLALLNGCGLKTLERKLVSAEEISSLASGGFQEGVSKQKSDLFLKIHMNSGAVYVLNKWTVDSVMNTVSGRGRLFDTYRKKSEQGMFTVDIDSVAIFETNKVRPSGSIAAMSIITGISVAATIYCIANPKACFGSCPTIYTYDGENEVLQAEGFSSSIAPSLEATDIDILHNPVQNDKAFRLLVKNEALETHIIRSLDLLAVQRKPNSRILLGIDGRFYQTKTPIKPQSCSSGADDFLEEVSYLDGKERFSRSDSTDLSVKEVIDLRFEHSDCNNVGLVIGCRQSLLSTYLFYSYLGFLGSQTGNWVAEMERGVPIAEPLAGSIDSILGGIEVFVKQPDGEFGFVGSVNEAGPLATDVHLVPLSSGTPGHVGEVRLRLARGHWRIDYLALVCLEGVASPIQVRPSEVLRGSVVDKEARLKLLDSSLTLVTFPGDEYTLVYDLPGPSNDFELFVKSRGYYLEWMRDEWVVNENMSRALEMTLAPRQALKKLAPGYKQVEAEMEDIFWSSKYVK